jgi:formylglycine-generating enzyme required for sulfatase activity
MGSYDQRQQMVDSQVNIAEAQFNMPPEMLSQLMAISESEQKEDLTVAELQREEWEPATLFIAAGEFLMGSKEGEGASRFEKPQFTFDLPAYRIGKYPVTNEEFAVFMRETNHPVVPEIVGWEGGHRPQPDQAMLPVKGITWYDALAYCLWLMEKTQRPYTLPSEAQWEKAARGTEGNLFPWGNDWQEGRFCNVDSRQVTPVNAYEDGASPFGCLDMVGNIREWTTTLWGRQRRSKQDERSKYPWKLPWKPNAGPDELKENRQVRRVTRGGTVYLGGTELRASRRASEFPYKVGLTFSRTGFRVALNVEE